MQKYTKFKIRIIANGNTPHPVYGITLPKDTALSFVDIWFVISKSGNSLILESGIAPEVKNA